MSSRGPLELDKDVDILGSLFASCSSITDRALGYRTLSSSTEENSARTVTDNIATEKELASWLDRRILDFKASLEQPTCASSSSSQQHLQGKSLERAIQRRQQELLDESFRQQQELIILKRIVQSDTAVAKTSMDDLEDEVSSRRADLLREAQRIRNRKVKSALESCRKLDQVRAKVLEATAESRRLQRENQVLWEKLQQQVEDNQETTSVADLTTTTTTQSHLYRENIALKRILADLLAGSGLDWIQDARLEEILSRVSE